MHGTDSLKMEAFDVSGYQQKSRGWPERFFSSGNRLAACRQV